MPMAAAADAKMRTTRRHPLRRSLDNPLDPGVLEGRFFAITDELDLLTRQGTVDKNRLALQMRYTTRLVIQ